MTYLHRCIIPILMLSDNVYSTPTAFLHATTTRNNYLSANAIHPSKFSRGTIATITSMSSESDDEIFQEEIVTKPVLNIPNLEKTWRYAKKPLVRIGNKGATESHGNSLRQMLEQHQVVKIKISTGKLGTLEEAFDAIRLLSEKKGAPEGMELLKVRDSENMIMVGISGMMAKIESGEFPPPPPPPYVPKTREEREEEQKEQKQKEE